MFQASSDEGLIASYQDLAKQIALALRHEEKRCDFLNIQKAQMMAIRDEVATMPEGKYLSDVSLCRTLLSKITHNLLES